MSVLSERFKGIHNSKERFSRRRLLIGGTISAGTAVLLGIAGSGELNSSAPPQITTIDFDPTIDLTQYIPPQKEPRLSISEINKNISKFDEIFSLGVDAQKSDPIAFKNENIFGLKWNDNGSTITLKKYNDNGKTFRNIVISSKKTPHITESLQAVFFTNETVYNFAEGQDPTIRSIIYEKKYDEPAHLLRDEIKDLKVNDTKNVLEKVSYFVADYYQYKMGIRA